MSEIIYNRAMVREQSIWPSFLYGVPSTEIENTKAVIFGLYANTYLHGHNYLEDIEAEELQRLVDSYNSNMAELAMEEQSLVLQIASDRYLKTVEIQIKNNALTTKQKQLNADEQEYQAKLAALEVDREALITKQAQIELARDRADLKNKDLDARIQIEGLAQEYVAVEVSQKQLEVARAELKVLTTALQGLEIQLDITNTAYRIVELETSKSGIKIDTAMAKVRTAENEFTSSSEGGSISERALFNAEEDKRMLEYELSGSELQQKKEDLVDKRKTNITTERDFVSGTLIPEEAARKVVHDQEQAEKQALKIQAYTDKETVSSEDVTRNTDAVAYKKSLAEIERSYLSQITKIRDSLYATRRAAASSKATASIAAAEQLATADIVTSLTHEIGSA